MAVITGCVGKKPAKFEEAVTYTGYGRFNLGVLLTGGGCLMSVIMETMGMMFVIPSAECDLDLDLTSKGLLASISFLGVVSSSHLWGFIADTRGRKNVLLISMVVGVVTSVCSSIVPEAWMFILIRYINGFFIGGASAVVYAYVGEFHDNTHRPKVVTWIATFVGLGNVVLPALSWLILPLEIDIDVPFLDIKLKPWRLLVISIGLPSLFFAIGLYNLPESPKYLLSQGKNHEALKILEHIFAKNTGRKADEFPVSDIIWDEIEIKNAKRTGLLGTLWTQTVPLFKRPYLIKTIMVCLLQFGTFASSSGFFMWYPQVLNRMVAYQDEGSMCDAIEFYNRNQAEIDKTDNDENCNGNIDEQVYQSSLYIGASLSVLYVFTGSVINIVGGKKLLIVILVTTALCGLTAQFIHTDIPARVLMGTFLMASTGVGIITTLTVDLYPTHLRGMALAISLMAGRFGAVTGSHLVGILIYKLCDYTFYIFGLDHLVLVIITVLLPESTKLHRMIEPLT